VCPIVSNKRLLLSCAEVLPATELSFGVVSGVGPGIDALDGVHMPQGKGLFRGFLGISVPIGVNV